MRGLLAAEPVEQVPPMRALSRSVHALRFSGWFADRTLPLWAQRGWTDRGGFVERLDFRLRPVDPGYRRLRTMARQAAVFVQATALDLGDYRALADAGWARLIGTAWSPMGGWLSRTLPDGRAFDQTFDLYDQAFGLYAIAARLRSGCGWAARNLVPAALDAIDAELRDYGRPGWRSRADASGRDQNSHMHLLEALLRLRTMAPGDRIDAMIDEICTLAVTRMIDSRSGAISEYFDFAWNADPDRPRVIEPGHQCEWYCLLSEAEAAGFGPFPQKDGLLDFALRFGLDDATGLLVDRCAPDGRQIDPRFRLWPQCELVKALAMAGCAAVPAGLLDDVLAQMLRLFLRSDMAGGWVDHIDGDLRPVVDTVPATSLYHLFEAWHALIRSGVIVTEDLS